MIEVDRVYKVEKQDSTLKAFVDIKVADAVLIKGIRVMAKKDGGLFAAMPSHLAGDGKYYDTVKFLTPEAKTKCKKWFLQPTRLKEFKNFKSCPIGYTGRKRKNKMNYKRIRER